MAHKLPVDDGCSSCSETLPPGPERIPYVSVYGQHIGSLLHKSLWQAAFLSPIQVGTADPALGQGQTALPEGTLLPQTLRFEADMLRQGLKPGEWRLLRWWS